MEANALLARLDAALSGPAGASEIDRTFTRIEKVAVLTTAIAALEQLGSRQFLNEKGPYAWRIGRSRLDQSKSPLRFLSPMLQYPRVLAFPQVKVAAAARLLLGNPGPKERAALVATVLGCSVAMSVHHHYGGDGADQVSFMTLLAALLAKAFPNDEKAKRAVLRMIAFQSCLSYAASGAIKLASPTWRSGRAISGVFRTKTFGDEDFYKFTKLHPMLPKLVAWTVILGETFFPVAMFTPKPVTRAILGGMGMFHLANSRFMGLNRFPLAFASTYPAVAFVAQEK